MNQLLRSDVCCITNSFLSHCFWMEKCWMSGMGSGALFIDHMESRCIVNEKTSWTRSEGVEGSQHAMKTLDNLAACNWHMELCLSGAAHKNSFDSTLPKNFSTTENCNHYCDGMVSLGIGSMGCVKAANSFIPMDVRKFQQIGIMFQEIKWDIGETI